MDILNTINKIKSIKDNDFIQFYVNEIDNSDSIADEYKKHIKILHFYNLFKHLLNHNENNKSDYQDLISIIMCDKDEYIKTAKDTLIYFIALSNKIYNIQMYYRYKDENNCVTFDNINPVRYNIICKLLSKTNEDKIHNFIYDEYEILDIKGVIPNELKNFVKSGKKVKLIEVQKGYYGDFIFEDMEVDYKTLNTRERHPFIPFGTLYHTY